MTLDRRDFWAENCNSALSSRPYVCEMKQLNLSFRAHCIAAWTPNLSSLPHDLGSWEESQRPPCDFRARRLVPLSRRRSSDCRSSSNTLFPVRGRPTTAACASARAQKRCSLHLYEPTELGLARLVARATTIVRAARARSSAHTCSLPATATTVRRVFARFTTIIRPSWTRIPRSRTALTPPSPKSTQ